MKPLAIFDFDKAIITVDSYRTFLLFAIKRSLLRKISAALIFPILTILSHRQTTHKYAIGVLSFLAFWGQKRSLFELRRDFTQHCANLTFYDDALTKIRDHQEKGHEILIISACPHWLLKKLISLGGIKNCHILGSKYHRYAGSILPLDNYDGQHKVSIAKSHGFSLYTWIAGYADSDDGLPLLRLCREQYIVNAKPEDFENIKNALGRRCQGLTWV